MPKKGKKKEKVPKKEKTSKQKAAQKEIYKRKALGLILGLIGLFLLIFVIFYTVSRVFRPEDIAKFLPKDSVIGLMQVNANSRHEQVQRFYQAFNKYKFYHYDSFVIILEEFFDTDYKKDINPWLNRQLGIALLEKPDVPGELDILLFVETRDKGETLRFLESRGLKDQEDYILSDDYNGVDIYRYSLSQSFNFIFLNNYLIVGNNENILKNIIDASKSSRNKLVNNNKYQKIAQNLPINNLVFSYIDFGKAMEFLKGNEDFMSEKGRELLAFEPFLKLYDAFGFTVVMENSDVAIQTFTSLNEEYLSGREFISFDLKYQANFLELIPEETLLFVGGHDLKKQIYNFSELFSAGGEVSYLIFEGMLRAQKNQYLGEEINMEEDIYPLLEGEYTLAVVGHTEENSLMIILELQDPLRDRDSIEIITDSFVRKSAILAPKVVEIELEDGTISQEIQTVPEEIKRSTEDYHGYEINVLNVGDQEWGVFYIILDNNLIITSKKEYLEKSIDLYISSQDMMRKNLKNSTIYREVISPVLRTSDEILFIKAPYLISYINESVPEWMDPYMEPFLSLSSGKNYFKDGISTIHYIKVD